MNRREFIGRTTVVVTAAAAGVFPSIAEGAPTTTVKLSPTENQMKEAAKNTTAGAATDAAAGAATGEAQRRGGGLLGGLRRIPGADRVIDGAANAAGNLFSDNGRGLKALIEAEVKKAQAAGSIAAVFFGAEAQSAALKTNLEGSPAKGAVLIIVDASAANLSRGDQGKLREAIENINKEHTALGTPLVQLYTGTESAKPALTQNAFAVTPDVLKNVVATAPAGAAPATTTPPPEADGPAQRR